MSAAAAPGVPLAEALCARPLRVVGVFVLSF